MIPGQDEIPDLFRARHDPLDMTRPLTSDRRAHPALRERDVTVMNITLAYCTLAVHDLDEALRFYRDVLGFKVRDDLEFEGKRWVSVNPPSQPDLQIVLQPPTVHQGATAADRQAIEDLMANGLLGRLVFVTDDCDVTFEHIEAAGADVMQEPINQPYGVRDCAFCDPSGNMLRFIQPRGR